MITSKEPSMIKLSLPYPISANKYWRNMRGRMIRSKEAEEFKGYVKAQCLVGKIKPLDGDVAVAIVLHPKCKKDGTASATRLDLDNCLKVVIDALNGFAYHDDNQIIRLIAEIGEPVQNGGLTVMWLAAE